MNWQQLVLELRREYKTINNFAPLVGLSVNRLRNIARIGTKNILWENGNKILELHRNLVK